jgi:metal-dependent amidase/aminoacylase/carboxypeptidase family protein
MLDAGALDDPRPTMVFGVHVSPFPSGYVAYRSGTQFAASCLVRIVVRGVPTHGSQPWTGVDPMPAAAAIISGTGQLYRQVPAWDPISITIGHVEDSGRFNIIGETVTLWGTIRCTVESQMSDLQVRLRRLSDYIAVGHGCEAEVDYLQPVPPVTNSQEWLDAALPTLRRVAGDAQVVPAPPTLVYDDVSVFVRAFGGLYLQYGVQDTMVEQDTLVAAEGGRGLVPNHHPAFYADDGALAGSVRLHVHVAVDHLVGLLDVPR